MLSIFIYLRSKINVPVTAIIINVFQSIHGLDKNKKLSKLFLYRNQIKKVENLSHLPILRVLNLSKNNLDSMQVSVLLSFLLDIKHILFAKCVVCFNYFFEFSLLEIMFLCYDYFSLIKLNVLFFLGCW